MFKQIQISSANQAAMKAAAGRIHEAEALADELRSINAIPHAVPHGDKIDVFVTVYAPLARATAEIYAADLRITDVHCVGEKTPDCDDYILRLHDLSVAIHGIPASSHAILKMAA